MRKPVTGRLLRVPGIVVVPLMVLADVSTGKFCDPFASLVEIAQIVRRDAVAAEVEAAIGRHRAARRLLCSRADVCDGFAARVTFSAVAWFASVGGARTSVTSTSRSTCLRSASPRSDRAQHSLRMMHWRACLRPAGWRRGGACSVGRRSELQLSAQTTLVLAVVIRSRGPVRSAAGPSGPDR